MPHATALHHSEDDHDDILIQQFLDARTTEDPFGLNRDLEPGEKADNAENYEDISDDDLAEDEDLEGERGSQTGDGHRADASSIYLEAFRHDIDFPALSNGHGLEGNSYDDDLFGEDLLSPAETNTGTGRTEIGPNQDGLSDFDDNTSAKPQTVPRPGSPFVHSPEQIPTRPMPLGSKESPPSKEFQRQQELLAMSRNGATDSDGLPAPPENREELLASLWPKFKRDKTPKFMDLLPPKRARYFGKMIPKPPKPLSPSKVSLELASDQEKSFRVSSIPNRINAAESSDRCILSIKEESTIEKDNEEDTDFESDFENELIQGISWQDLLIVCEDWDTHIAAESPGSRQNPTCNRNVSSSNASKDMDPDPDPDCEWPFAKVSWNPYETRKVAYIYPQRRKIDHLQSKMMCASQSLFPSFEDPEYATSKIAKTITLDLNDSRLLVDHVQPNFISRNVFGRSDLRRAGRGAFTKGLGQRYNISNDEAYDLLKENHQSKVRSMLGNVAVEHSLPAVRLQWPFVSNTNLP